ncbi:MAG: hypothetical protein K8S87_09675 [Planctomycetes bacterium]|nr:hypothetical protein [Planctomycetota bacterium]
MNTPINSRNGKFEYAEFRKMIATCLNAGYSFEKFPDAENLLKMQKKFVLLRHDIDLDLEKAYKMAQIEHDLGVEATYFLMLRTEHYNLFSEKNSFYVNEIIKLGHEIGIHFDVAAYPENSSVEDLNRSCMVEVAMLEGWFGIKVSTISYHRPNKLVLSGNPALTKPLLHTYMPVFRDKIKYYADSRGLWRYGNPLEGEEFKAGTPLHLCIHPIWWNDAEIESNIALNSSIAFKKDILVKSFEQNFTIFEYYSEK